MKLCTFTDGKGARIGVVLWLAQDLAVEHHCRVGAEHELVVR